MVDVPDPLHIVQTGGHYSDGSPVLITNRIRGFCKLVGIPEELIAQGCLHKGSLSATTHNGKEVFDGPYLGDDLPTLHRHRNAGAVCWPRDERDDPAYGGSNRHTHYVLPGTKEINTEIDPEAIAQVKSYWLGDNGLANGAPDRYPYRPKTLVRFNYHKWYVNQAIDAAEGRLEKAIDRKGKLYTQLVRFVYRFQHHKPHKNH